MANYQYWLFILTLLKSQKSFKYRNVRKFKKKRLIFFTYIKLI